MYGLVDADEVSPRHVDAFKGKKVVGASTANWHIAAWTDNGELFTFGHSYVGRLGHGDDTSRFLEPIPIQVLGALKGKRVVGAAAGHSHTVAWTEDDEIFAFGLNMNGELGISPNGTEFDTPHPVVLSVE